MGPIQGFDTTGFPVTFAAEVKNFDPLNFVDKKEARKMGRFIHFAFAATQEAMAQSGLKITPENADRVGVFIGSGIGGFEIIEREHSNLLGGRTAQDLALLYSRDDCEYGGGANQHSLWSAGADFGHCDSVRDKRQLHRRLGAHDSARRCGRDDCRRRGSIGHGTFRRRLCRDARALDAQR